MSWYSDSATGWTIEALWFDLEQVQGIFPFFKLCQMALGPNWALCLVDTGVVFSEVEQPADCLHLAGARLAMNQGTCIRTQGKLSFTIFMCPAE